MDGKYSQKRLEFVRRVMVLIQDLIAAGRVATIKELIAEADLYYKKYTEIDREVRQHGGEGQRYKTVDFELVFLLVTKYGVSADWLVTGCGSKYSNIKPQKND